MSASPVATASTYGLDEAAFAFYRRALEVVRRSGVPFLIGGAYAFSRYTGVERHTRDLDVFVRPRNARAMLDALAAGGFRTEMTFPHWLGKAYEDDLYVDVIFSSGNAHCDVDETWFERGVAGEVLGVPVVLIPPEEMLWQKAYIMERERFDGADVAHLLRASGPVMNWRRVLERFDEHWRVLLAHLVLFGFVYPAERDRVPRWVLDELTGRLKREVDARAPSEPVCQGTLLSRSQYLHDIERAGYRDARLVPTGDMRAREIKVWTDAAPRDP